MNIKLNNNFSRLRESYLFAEIRERIEEFKAKNGNEHEKRIISLGIGDVSLPLSACVCTEMERAAREMGTSLGFHGYGDTQGEPSLRDAISKRYGKRGIDLSADEIFISDGAKSDLGNLNDVLGDNEVVICDPVYPVYLDSAIISGRRVRLLTAKGENGFLPSSKSLSKKPRVIFLCSPNNPTGVTFSREEIKGWVDHALFCGSLIIFDAAYESYIREEPLPHSIFEIEGARKCAIEVCSFSKMAGFTGVRCGWTAIAKENPLYKLWKRRQNTKFNGASYIAQRGALAALSSEGARECALNIDYYMENARLLAALLRKKKISFVGGVNAPYLWAKCPRGMSSWELFDHLLNEARVVVTPGVGFGRAGEGWFRLSSFGSRHDILEAIERLERTL